MIDVDATLAVVLPIVELRPRCGIPAGDAHTEVYAVRDVVAS
jgi:hypothetical protein